MKSQFPYDKSHCYLSPVKENLYSGISEMHRFRSSFSLRQPRQDNFTLLLHSVIRLVKEEHLMILLGYFFLFLHKKTYVVVTH